MRDTFLDIVAHTGDLGFIETVKIDGTKDSTRVEAIDKDKVVIINGTLKKADPDFNGGCGLSNLQLLKFYCNFPSYRGDKASIEVVREDRNDQSIIAEFQFTSETKDSTATFRVLNAALVPPVAKFVGANWDIDITPSNSRISEFSALANGLMGLETYFMPKTDKDGNLRFYIGDEVAATNKANMVFHETVKGEFAGGLLWPIQHVLAVLKIATGEKATPRIRLMAKGALEISFSSDLIDWSYIFPGKRK